MPTENLVSDHVMRSPFGRLFLNELADGANGHGLTETRIWEALDIAIRTSVQELHGNDAHPLTAGGRGIADDVPAHPATSWWASPAPASQTGLQDLEYTGPRSDRPLGWWSTPPDVLLTSREIPGTGVCVHLLHRDGYDWEPSRPLVWRADVGDARILEISTPDDWRALVEMAPRHHPSDIRLPRSHRRARAYQPDWAYVVSRFDGVHVSVAGLLATAYTPIPVLDGFTYLAGWHPDVTAWLNPAPLFREGPRPLMLAMPQR